LAALNYSNQFRFFFGIFDAFLNDGRRCQLEDTSNWALVPPLEFNLTYSPSSLILRPGDEKDVQLHLNSNTNVGLQNYTVLLFHKSN
jgi:hypothetical protein